jgi:hypothetical protein
MASKKQISSFPTSTPFHLPLLFLTSVIFSICGLSPHSYFRQELYRPIISYEIDLSLPTSACAEILHTTGDSFKGVDDLAGIWVQVAPIL